MTTHDLLNQLIADRDRLSVAIDVLAERCGRPTPPAAIDPAPVYTGAPPDPDGHAPPEAAPPSRRAKPKSAKPRTTMAAHDAPPSRARNGHPPLRERIVTALHGLPSASWDDIIDACQPTTPDSLKLCLRECVAAGLVERVGRGQYALPTRVIEGGNA